MRDKGPGEILAIYGANIGVARELIIVPGEIKNVDGEVVVVLVSIDIKKVKFGLGANVCNEEFNFPYILSSGKIVALGERVVVFLGGKKDVAISGRNGVGGIEAMPECELGDITTPIAIGVQREPVGNSLKFVKPVGPG